MQEEWDPISEQEVQDALIQYVYDGTPPSQRILKEFLSSDRLKVIKSLGAAGLIIKTSNHKDLERYKKLSAVARAQVRTWPYDISDHENNVFEPEIADKISEATPPTNSSLAAKMTAEALSYLEPDNYTKE